MTSSPITDEMINAGVKALNRNGFVQQQRYTVEQIYLAMRSSAPPVMGMEEMVERAAKALAKADGKDPDAPAWVEGYGNRARTFGICWRDQYADKARAALEASGLLSTPLVTGRE